MEPKDKSPEPDESDENTEDPTDLRAANENIRQAQGEDAIGTPDSRRTGNKPAFDRGR